MSTVSSKRASLWLLGLMYASRNHLLSGFRAPQSCRRPLAAASVGTLWHMWTTAACHNCFQAEGQRSAAAPRDALLRSSILQARSIPITKRRLRAETDADSETPIRYGIWTTQYSGKFRPCPGVTDFVGCLQHSLILEKKVKGPCPYSVGPREFERLIALGQTGLVTY